MATANPFDLLGDDDNDDVSQLAAKVVVPAAAVQPKKGAQAQAVQPAKSAKLPTKPPPPAQAGNNSPSISFILGFSFVLKIEFGCFDWLLIMLFCAEI